MSVPEKPAVEASLAGVVSPGYRARWPWNGTDTQPGQFPDSDRFRLSPREVPSDKHGMRSRVLLSGLGAATLVAVAGLAAAPSAPSPRPELTSAIDRSVAVTWTELATSPCRHQAEEVRFPIQFHGLPERWQAGPTRFGPGAFLAVSAWADEQFPWFENEYGNPAVRLYVRRGSHLERTFREGRVHQRYEVRGIVREVWRGLPWIELTSAERLDEEIGEASVFHASRAIALIEESSYVLADEALQQALAAPLPPHARSELSRLRDLCAAEIAEPKAPPIRPRRR